MRRIISKTWRPGGPAAGAVLLVSLGVAAGTPTVPSGADRLVAASIAALREAQAQGGNAVVVHPFA